MGRGFEGDAGHGCEGLRRRVVLQDLVGIAEVAAPASEDDEGIAEGGAGGVHEGGGHRLAGPPVSLCHVVDLDRLARLLGRAASGNHDLDHVVAALGPDRATDGSVPRLGHGRQLAEGVVPDVVLVDARRPPVVVRAAEDQDAFFVDLWGKF